MLVCLSSTELTNLIIMRNSSFVEAQLSPTLEGNKLSHIQFQMIKYEDLKWVRRFYCYSLRLLPLFPIPLQYCCFKWSSFSLPIAACVNTTFCIQRKQFLTYVTHNKRFLRRFYAPSWNNCLHTQEESLGQGSFTRLFKGYKSDTRNGGKNVSVFLKELDVTHRNLWEVGPSLLNSDPLYDIVLV